MVEWVRLRKDGATSATMAVEECHLFAEVARSEETPGEGWHEVVKAPGKPTPGEGQTLAFTYEVGDDGKAYKTYALVPAGTRYAVPSVVYSKLKCYEALVGMGVWADVKAWLEEAGLWDAFVLAQDVRSDNARFREGLAAMQARLGLTDAQVSEFLAKCVYDGKGA